MMKILDHTVEFFIGAATMGEGANKWSWPGRDLKYLYRRKYSGGSVCSVEPDLETWKQYGCMIGFVEGQGMRLMKVADFARHFGDARTLDLLSYSPGTYLGDSKHEILDRLGCPR